MAGSFSRSSRFWAASSRAQRAARLASVRRVWPQRVSSRGASSSHWAQKASSTFSGRGMLLRKSCSCSTTRLAMASLRPLPYRSAKAQKSGSL